MTDRTHNKLKPTKNNTRKPDDVVSQRSKNIINRLMLFPPLLYYPFGDTGIIESAATAALQVSKATVVIQASKATMVIQGSTASLLSMLKRNISSLISPVL
jgi:hypothetical protein